MRKQWTNEEREKMISLASSGLYTFPEISQLLERNRASIANEARRLGINNQAYMERKTKHKHLREDVMRYFVTHTAEETMKRFSLTQSEFKSVMTIGYRDPKFKNLRKETRRHDSWSTDEFLFLLKHAGIQPRDWIAKKLKRGSYHAVKDRLKLLGVTSRYLNGLTISEYRSLFEKEPREFIQTKAGPKRLFQSATCFKIIPWVSIQKDVEDKHLELQDALKKIVSALCMFQTWIHKGKSKNIIFKELNRIGGLK